MQVIKEVKLTEGSGGDILIFLMHSDTFSPHLNCIRDSTFIWPDTELTYILYWSALRRPQMTPNIDTYSSNFLFFFSLNSSPPLGSEMWSLFLLELHAVQGREMIPLRFVNTSSLKEITKKKKKNVLPLKCGLLEAYKQNLLLWLPLPSPAHLTFQTECNTDALCPAVCKPEGNDDQAAFISVGYV